MLEMLPNFQAWTMLVKRAESHLSGAYFVGRRTLDTGTRDCQFRNHTDYPPIACRKLCKCLEVRNNLEVAYYFLSGEAAERLRLPAWRVWQCHTERREDI